MFRLGNFSHIARLVRHVYPYGSFWPALKTPARILPMRRSTTVFTALFAMAALTACGGEKKMAADSTASAAAASMDSAKGAMGAMADSAKGAMGAMADSAKGAMGAMADSAKGAMGAMADSAKGKMGAAMEKAGAAATEAGKKMKP